MVKDGLSGDVDSSDLENAGAVASSAAAAGRALLNPKKESSPPREIQALRNSFEDALKEIDVTLVVLIDDLDRCLPGTTISTLEAIRLFLFLENTAFVIAADDAMIKHAVKQHFGGLEDETLVTNYFDKLVQIPIRVPALGTQEVRAYMMMLFIENSELDAGLQCHVAAGVAPPQGGQAIAVFRIFQEMLSNVARHAKARSVLIRIAVDDPPQPVLYLDVRDDGVGATPQALNDAQSWGVIGMRERAAQFGGHVLIDGAPGQGTLVRLVMPLQEPLQ